MLVFVQSRFHLALVEHFADCHLNNSNPWFDLYIQFQMNDFYLILFSIKMIQNNFIFKHTHTQITWNLANDWKSINSMKKSNKSKMCVCFKHTCTHYNFFGVFSLLFSLKVCFTRTEKKSYLDQRILYEKQFRMTNDYKLNPIVIWYVFYRRLSSLMNVLWQYETFTKYKSIQVHSESVCMLYDNLR